MSHNPYFNRWFSAIYRPTQRMYSNYVTILILIDGFLQLKLRSRIKCSYMSHNPYFNRWFSAIKKVLMEDRESISHNPYFNRWFSAMWKQIYIHNCVLAVTILILIDGFLQ